MGITSVFLWDPFKFLDLIFYNEFSGQNQRTVLQNKFIYTKINKYINFKSFKIYYL